MDWLNETDNTRNYTDSDATPDEQDNKVNHVVHSFPEKKMVYNPKKEQHEIPLDETQITNEQRELLRTNSIPVSEMFAKDKGWISADGSDIVNHEIFLAKRFVSQHDIDAEGKIHKNPTSGTIYSRYTIFNNTLACIRVDNLTEYYQSGNSQKIRKIESSFVKFESLDKQTQQQVRMRLPEVNREVSEEGMKFIFSHLEKICTDSSGVEEPSGNEKYTDEESNLKYNTSKTQAQEWLAEDLKLITFNINAGLRVFTTQHEFDAIVSMTSVHGSGSNVVKTLLNLMNTFQFKKAATYIEQCGFPKYRAKSEAIIFSMGQYKR